MRYVMAVSGSLLLAVIVSMSAHSTLPGTKVCAAEAAQIFGGLCVKVKHSQLVCNGSHANYDGMRFRVISFQAGSGDVGALPCPCDASPDPTVYPVVVSGCSGGPDPPDGE